MITTTTGTVNTSDLEARKLSEAKPLKCGPGLFHLSGWGVYNTELDAWLTFESSIVKGIGKMARFQARRPYTLGTKKLATQVAEGGLADATHEWIAL